jgi:hypothetical protein
MTIRSLLTLFPLMTLCSSRRRPAPPPGPTATISIDTSFGEPATRFPPPTITSCSDTIPLKTPRLPFTSSPHRFLCLRPWNIATAALSSGSNSIHCYEILAGKDLEAARYGISRNLERRQHGGRLRADVCRAQCESNRLCQARPPLSQWRQLERVVGGVGAMGKRVYEKSTE